MKPESDFTTPRRLIVPISRHFFPVEHPEPCSCTTGLKNGSLFPDIAHFFSSLGFGASAGFAVGGPATVTGDAFAATTVLACCLVSAFGAGPTAGLATATAGAATGFPAAALVAVAAGAITGFAPAAGVFAATCGCADEAALAAGIFAAGAGPDLATAVPASCVCRIRTTLPAGPGTTS